MTNDEKAAAWQRLCDRHEAARDAYYSATSPVMATLGAIYRGESDQNPPLDQLDQADRAWKAWRDVIDEMHAFAKKHA
jgi:hypothetical protein